MPENFVGHGSGRGARGLGSLPELYGAVPTAAGLVMAPAMRANFEPIACEEVERLLALFASAITFEILRSQRL